jgi:hypothetical protein
MKVLAISSSFSRASKSHRILNITQHMHLPKDVIVEAGECSAVQCSHTHTHTHTATINWCWREAFQVEYCNVYLEGVSFYIHTLYRTDVLLQLLFL